jgi:hypothetical protein
MPDEISKRRLRGRLGYTASEFEQAYASTLIASERVRSVPSVLLVDDVCTEGSTLGVCGKALRAKNPKCTVVTSTACQMAQGRRGQSGTLPSSWPPAPHPRRASQRRRDANRAATGASVIVPHRSGLAVRSVSVRSTCNARTDPLADRSGEGPRGLLGETKITPIRHKTTTVKSSPP